jgi:hypothetical protein
LDEVGTPARDQQGRDRAERLADHRHRRELELLDGEGDVGHARLERNVGGPPLALAVAARVEGDHAVALGEPARRPAPLAGVATETVQKERGGAGAAEVGGGQPDPLALHADHR